MHVVELLDRAEAAGLRIVREGDLLHVEGPAGADSIIEALRQQKADILSAWWCWQASRILRQVDDDDTRSDLLDVFDEIAASREYEHELHREDAEYVAFGGLIAECLRRGLPVVVSVDRGAAA